MVLRIIQDLMSRKISHVYREKRHNIQICHSDLVFTQRKYATLLLPHSIQLSADLRRWACERHVLARDSSVLLVDSDVSRELCGEVVDLGLLICRSLATILRDLGLRDE